MRKIFLLDFEDSYTYNIVAEIFHYSNILVEVIALKNHQKFFSKLIKKHNKSDWQEITIILGPGPGKPLDYHYQFSTIKHLIKMHYPIKFLGICLGHQLITQCFGMKIEASNFPKHGQTEEIFLNTWWKNYLKTEKNTLIVQRYNSLGVIPLSKKANQKMILVNQEVVLFYRDNILSMQFHPESVGSLDKEIFFNMINRFL